MRKWSILFTLMVIISMVITIETFGQVVQFKQIVTLSCDSSATVKATDSIGIGVNSGNPNAVSPILANTYMPDLGDTMGVAGQWKELAAPASPPPLYSFRVYLTDFRSLWPAGIKLRPYDFRGYTASDQIDTFQINVVAGSALTDGMFPETGLTFSWKSTLSVNASIWALKKRTSSAPAPVGTWSVLVANMATTGTSYTDASASGQANITYRIIKTGAGPILGVRDYITSLPTKFELGQNYPNPFNPTTEFNFSVAKKGRATLQVFNTLGQEVMNLFDGTAEPGKSYQVTLDGNRLASGVYFYRLTSVEGSAIKKMVLLK